MYLNPLHRTFSCSKIFIPKIAKKLMKSATIGPCRRMVFWPRGARRANWSKVRISPPAFRILALAPSVTRRAQI